MKTKELKGFNTSEKLIEKLFIGTNDINDLVGFLKCLLECNNGTRKAIRSNPISVMGRMYFIAFEHVESIYKTMSCKLKLYYIGKDRKGFKPFLVYTDPKPNYVRIKDDNIIISHDSIVGEVRLYTFFRKCLSIMFETEYRAFRTLISLDLFCEWTEEYIFSTDKNKAPDLATHLYQKVNAQAIEAFNYCLENSNMVYI